MDNAGVDASGMIHYPIGTLEFQPFLKA